jgi:hypothetical protein
MLSQASIYVSENYGTNKKKKATKPRKKRSKKTPSSSIAL